MWLYIMVRIPLVQQVAVAVAVASGFSNIHFSRESLLTVGLQLQTMTSHRIQEFIQRHHRGVLPF